MDTATGGIVRSAFDRLAPLHHTEMPGDVTSANQAVQDVARGWGVAPSDK
jgi:hypothetical protein